MKKLGKRFLSLMLALTFVFSLNTVAFAYDTTVAGIDSVPGDEWYLTQTFHWVVRGETLAGIADKYGTTVADIKAHNAAYFKDLDLRNQTTGLSVLVETGVRLKIYDQVTVKHYVQRGDTLAKMAGGALKNGNFALITTAQAIKEENVSWFASLAAMNETLGSNYSLVESDQIFNVGHTDPLYKEWSAVTSAGLPLYITVPVRVSSWSEGSLYGHRDMTWLENNLETQATVSGVQLPFINTLSTNSYLSGVVANAWNKEVKPAINATLINSRYVTGIYDRNNATVIPGDADGAARLVTTKYTIVFAESTGSARKDGLQLNKGDRVYMTGKSENGRIEIKCAGNRLGWINTADVEWQ